VADEQIIVLDDQDAVASESARRIVSALSAAVAERGSAHLGLTGGSSAVPLFVALRSEPNRSALDWGKVHLWWVDERFVPNDHPESNAGAAYRLLLGVPQHMGQTGQGGNFNDVAEGEVAALPVDPAHVHPVEVEESLSDDEPVQLAAQRYEREIRRFVPLGHGGVPMFDVLLTGIGPDGHIFSLFPGSPGLEPDAPIVMAIPAPQHVEPHIDRVTLSARVLPVAGLVLVMSTGEGKAEMLANVLGPEKDVARWPAQAARLPNAVWLLDRAAAAQLPRSGDQPIAQASANQ
jgi:6-phosphogluconolactonase